MLVELLGRVGAGLARVGAVQVRVGLERGLPVFPLRIEGVAVGGRCASSVVRCGSGDCMPPDPRRRRDLCPDHRMHHSPAASQIAITAAVVAVIAIRAPQRGRRGSCEPGCVRVWLACEHQPQTSSISLPALACVRARSPHGRCRPP
jgi:hypothetical protein